MNKVMLWLVAIFLVGAVAIAEAQQPTKVPRIGFFWPVPALVRRRFLQGLPDLGYIEGKNVHCVRTLKGRSNGPRYRHRVVRLKVDVIVSGSTTGIRAAKNATSAIPIVMTSVGDPVGVGLVASLARPGGNITG